MADEAKVIVSIETVLRGLNKTATGLDRLEKQLRSLASIKLGSQSTARTDKAVLAAQKLAQQQQRLIIQAQELANRQERARQTTERLAQAQQRLQAASQRAAQGLGQQANAHVRAFRAIQATNQQNLRQVQQINAQTTRQAQQQARIQQQAARAIGVAQATAARQGANALIASLNQQANAIQVVQERLNTLGTSVQRAGAGLKSTGATLSVALTAPLVALATLATRNAVEFDSLRRGLEVIAGSSQEAGRQLARLTEIAKLPGIGFQEAIQGSIRLQAVGFSALDAEKALVQFANAVALTGGGREELSRITVQLGQLAAKGKIVAQDLKPIIEAGPAVGQALLQAFGTVNSEDIQKLGLSSQEFFDRLTDALAKLPRAAAGAKNSLENFSDSVFRASLALGEAILPPLTKLIDFLEPLVTQLAATFRTLPEGVQLAVVAVGAFASALGPVLFIVGGLVSGLGALVTVLATVIPILGTIGLPAVLALLVSVGALLTELTATVVVLGLAWRDNFLGIRKLVSDAADAVNTAFQRIRTAFDEATRRILPTLQSITTKVLTAVSGAWERYGKVVVETVGAAFRFVADVTETFLREFSNLVDLILKLIDGDWRGAWRAFARILVDAFDSTLRILGRLNAVFERVFSALVAFVLVQAVRFVEAAQRLARTFIGALAVEIVAGFPTIRDALETLLITAVASINVADIARRLVGRLFAELRKAASEGLPPALLAQGVGVDVGAGEGLFRKKARTAPRPSSGDSKGERTLARQADKLRDAQDKFAEQEADNRLNLARAGIEQQFDITKDGLDRESRALEDSFEDRLATVRAYFAKRQKLQEDGIDAELVKERGLSGALVDEFAERRKQIQREFESARQTAIEDPKLKGRARDLALQTAEQERQTALSKAHNEFETANAAISTRILTLQKQRADVGTEIARQLRETTRELTRQQEAVRADLFEEQGRTSDAESIRLRDRFRETLRELRVDVSGLGTELQDALNNADLSVLQQRLDDLPEPVRQLIELLNIGIKRAQIAEQQQLVADLSTGLQVDTTRIQNRVLDGLLSQRDAQAEIIALQQKYKALLLDILQGELAKAEAIGDQSQILAIQGQILETQRLGQAIDEVGIQLNRDLFGNIESGLEGFFENARRGFDGLRDAAISFGEALLGTLNRIAAQSTTQKLEDIFKPDATNTKGTPGGFLSKIFGLSPSASQGAVGASSAAVEATSAAALETGAVTAGAALTTAATAAGTALATGGATAATTLISSAAAFASTIIAAGAAFAASIAAGAGAQAIGGLGSALGGAATGDLIPATPGGQIIRVAEAGHDEVVLTTDPRHAIRQANILRAYLAQTKGLFGRFKVPEFATGGLIPTRAEAEMNLLNSINRPSQTGFRLPDAALETGSNQQQLMNLRIINQVASRDLARPYLTSEEGVRDVLNIISQNSNEVIRRLPPGR